MVSQIDSRIPTHFYNYNRNIIVKKEKNRSAIRSIGREHQREK